MMSERQVVIVKEAQNLQDLNKEGGQRLLLDYIQNPLPSTILVICHKYKSIDKRKALGKQLDKHTVLIDAKKLYDNQMADCDKCGCGHCTVTTTSALTNQLSTSQVVTGNSVALPSDDFMKSLFPHGIDYPPKPLS